VLRWVPGNGSSFFQQLLSFCIAVERTGGRTEQETCPRRKKDRKTEAFILQRDFVVVL
jgi:hypothetical protein